MGHQRTCRTRNPTSVLTPGADIPNPSFRERQLRARSRRSIDASLFLGRGLAIEAGGRSLAQPGYDIRPILVAWAPHDGPWKEKLRREEVHLDLATLFAPSAHSGAGGLGLSASAIAGRLGVVVEENRHLRLMDDRRRTADVTLGTACGLHRPFFQLR